MCMHTPHIPQHTHNVHKHCMCACLYRVYLCTCVCIHSTHIHKMHMQTYHTFMHRGHSCPRLPCIYTHMYINSTYRHTHAACQCNQVSAGGPSGCLCFCSGIPNGRGEKSHLWCLGLLAKVKLILRSRYPASMMDWRVTEGRSVQLACHLFLPPSQPAHTTLPPPSVSRQ